MTIHAFSPLQTLAAQLLPHALEPSEDGAHDLSHLHRVWHTVRTLHAQEGGDLEVLLAAVLLHDCVAIEKNSPLRSQASRMAAEKACAVLADLHWPNEKVSEVAHAIEAHSFSANIPHLARSENHAGRRPPRLPRYARCSAHVLRGRAHGQRVV